MKNKMPIGQDHINDQRRAKHLNGGKQQQERKVLQSQHL